MPLGSLLEPFMPLLAAQLDIRLAQPGQQGLLTGPMGLRVRIGWKGVASHGHDTRRATC